MSEPISVFESEDTIRSATVYKAFDVYLVVFNDRKERIVEKKQYITLEDAENASEDWVLNA